MTRALVPLLVLALPPCAAAQQGVRVEGFAGRVEALTDSARIELLTGLGPREYEGAGHLESGASSRARLTWASRASLEILGRAGLEWSAHGAAGVRAFELERAELEVRRGPLLLDWPGGWHASFAAGAYRLSARPGGALELETVAGGAPRVWTCDGASFRELAGPAPGERLVIGAAAPAWSQARPERWSPWESVSWPWGAERDLPAGAPLVHEARAPSAGSPLDAEPAPEALVLPRGERALETPAQPGLVERHEPELAPQPAPETAPEIEPVLRGDPGVAPQPCEEPVAPACEPTPAPQPPAPSMPSAPPAAPAFDPAQWGGLAREELVVCGALATQKRADLVLESTPSGGIALRLRSDAARPAWVFRAGSDLELLPGTLALFDAEGRLFAELGRVLEHAAPAGRCAPSAAGFAPAR